MHSLNIRPFLFHEFLWTLDRKQLTYSWIQNELVLTKVDFYGYNGDRSLHRMACFSPLSLSCNEELILGGGKMYVESFIIQCERWEKSSQSNFLDLDQISFLCFFIQRLFFLLEKAWLFWAPPAVFPACLKSKKACQGGRKRVGWSWHWTFSSHSHSVKI